LDGISTIRTEVVSDGNDIDSGESEGSKSSRERLVIVCIMGECWENTKRGRITLTDMAPLIVYDYWNQPLTVREREISCAFCVRMFITICDC